MYLDRFGDEAFRVENGVLVISLCFRSHMGFGVFEVHFDVSLLTWF